MADTDVKYTKPFDGDQEDSASVGEMRFSQSNRSKTAKVLAIVVVILVILLIIFLALFVNERNRYNDCKSRSCKG